MEPYSKKLGMDTWHYAKRCFLGLIENLAKHMIMVCRVPGIFLGTVHIYAVLRLIYSYILVIKMFKTPANFLNNGQVLSYV